LRKIRDALIVFASLSAVGFFWAHHSPSAIYQMGDKFGLTGTVTKDGNGTGAWKFASIRQLGSGESEVAGSILRKPLGKPLRIERVRAKDGFLYGYLQKITLPDGVALELVNPNDVK